MSMEPGHSILERLERLERDNDALRQEIDVVRRALSPDAGDSAAPSTTMPPASRVTRRGVLTAGVGAAVASAVATLAGGIPTQAHDPDDVRLGADNPARSTRTLIVISSSSGADAIVGLTRNIGNGVVGQSTNGGSGVVGYAGDGAPPRIGGYGVAAVGSGSNGGVFGKSTDSGPGVYGTSDAGAGVRASSGTAAGLIATGGPYGVSATATQIGGAGVLGRSTFGGSGLHGEGRNQGRGGVFKGDAAQVRLIPSDSDTHPTAGRAGDLYLDSIKRLWLCKGDTTWVRVA
jgi:hypothetical protein